jgi:hypothetical protein
MLVKEVVGRSEWNHLWKQNCFEDLGLDIKEECEKRSVKLLKVLNIK